MTIDPTEAFDAALFDREALFEAIAADLSGAGFGVYDRALPAELLHGLRQRAEALAEDGFAAAGVGRAGDYTLSRQIRRDQIHWIEADSPVEQQWLAWAKALQTYLNRRLYLGLTSFESHFARYRSGDFYRRHRDAFRGQSNRTVTTVLYLNPEWQAAWGGELMVYQDDTDLNGFSVVPLFGRLVVFLSEEFPHEVRPALQERHSIAGWFRVKGEHP